MAAKTSQLDRPRDVGSKAVTLLSADRPISAFADDRLGRSDFAKSLAKILGDWRGHDSLVVALYGHWGSGKSSLKNLVLRAIRDRTSESGLPTTEVLEFNPWEWVGHTELTTAFFSEVGKKLGHDADGSSRKEAAKEWLAYSAFLGMGEAVLESALKVLALGLLLVGATGIGVSLLRNLAEVGPIINALAYGALLVVGILGQSRRVLEKVGKWISARSTARDRTLPEVKAGLSKTLRKLDKNVLVVIDDVDRLADSDVRTVFQLVKANADFPNFVYFLPLQRDSIVRALRPLTDTEGEEFLEKIIQIAFDVPNMGRVDVDNVLQEKLNLLFANEIKSERFDQVRWINMYQRGVRQYFLDLRDVNRFVSSLAFHVELLKKDNVLEVNPIDLIGVEVLRLFEPRVYYRLRDSKQLLTGYIPSESSAKQRFSGEIEGLARGVEAARAGVAMNVIRLLFPNREWALGGSTYAPESANEWRARLQVCIDDYFDRYFQLTIPESDISQSEIEELIANSADRDDFFARLDRYCESGKIESALERLDGSVEQLQIENTIPILRGLFDIGEKLPEPEPGFFSIGADWTALRIARKLLKRDADGARRSSNLKGALKGTKGISLPVHLLSIEEKAVREKSKEELVIDPAEWPLFKEIALAHIRDSAKSGALQLTRDLIYVLYRWADWATLDEVRAWTASLLLQQDGALRFLKALVQRSVSQTVGDAAARITWYIRLQNLEKFTETKVVQEKLEKVGTLDAESARAVEAFQNALRRRQEGKSDDDLDN